MKTLLTVALIPMMAAVAMAQGLVIPKDPDLPPLALTKHQVRVEIDRQGAVTTVEQVFRNNTPRKLEAQYVFPIPKGAAMGKFTMLVDGKESTGELVEKNEARAVYTSMVNRTQEPALLEYVGSQVFRASLYPIHPESETKITIRFVQVLPAEESMVRYVYPVRNGARKGATVHGEFSIDVSIRSDVAIGNIYSPSHSVTIARRDELTSRVGYSEKNATLDKDFQLYYGLSDQEIGFHLVTHRPNPSEPGYFMMLMTPRSRMQVEKIVERDLVFVVDTSGSMAGEKIRQARNALKYCIERLNDGDRFNIVPFSTDVNPWKPDFVSAKEFRRAGLKFADTLIARGGTAIEEAIRTGLSFTKDPSRPTVMIFMTDGKPTIGATDAAKILSNIKPQSGVKIFAWGVGYDLDTHLVDAIADAGGGVSEYVHPEEDIATKVAAFYSKASRPVMTNVELKALTDRVQLVNLHPNAPTDLYAGCQMVVMGRYTGDGDVALRLTGRVNDKVETFDYEAAFPAQSGSHAFLEVLWAKREIGALLTAIRLHGEKKELVDDVVRLSIEYGIQTPYTSFLIDAQEPQARGGGKSGPSPAPGFIPMAQANRAMDKVDSMALKPSAPPAVEPKEDVELAKARAEGFKEKDGKKAVEAADYVRRLRESRDDGDTRIAKVRKTGGRKFYDYRGVWIDEKFDADQAVTTVKFGSVAYFKLIERRPELIETLKLGTAVIVVTAKGRALAVAESGVEALTDEAIDALFTK